MNTATEILAQIDNELHIHRETIRYTKLMPDPDPVYKEWVLKKHQRAIDKLTQMRQDLLRAAATNADEKAPQGHGQEALMQQHNK
jgi:hypothetical protein